MNIPELTLYDLVGNEIMTRPPYQWVKLFGKQNCISLNPVVIDRDYIRREACNCAAACKTSNALANVLYKFYAEWITNHESITGLQAESLHTRIINAIVGAYKIKWLCNELKNPHTLFMRYFDTICSRDRYYYMVDTEGKKNRGPISSARKVQAQRLFMRCSGRLGTEDGNFIDYSRRAPFNSVDFDWDNLIVPTPEDLYMLAYG